MSFSVISSLFPTPDLNLISGSNDLENEREYSSSPENTDKMVKKEKLAIESTKTEKIEII